MLSMAIMLVRACSFRTVQHTKAAGPNQHDRHAQHVASKVLMRRRHNMCRVCWQGPADLSCLAGTAGVRQGQKLRRLSGCQT
jgi:hypothetical protein